MKIEIGPYPSLYDVQLDLFGKEETPEQHVSIHIDEWDTWNMDTTLAKIIVPMLHQLKRTKQGAPFIKLEDVPEYLRGVRGDNFGHRVHVLKTDDKHFERWDWVLGEMIFAFESKLFDWEDQFWVTKPDIDWDQLMKKEVDEDGYIPTPWKSMGELDEEGRNAYQARISNGFRLFGAYYENLWD